MKRTLSILLAFLMLVSCTSALAAYNDHTDYSQFPLVKDGESMTVTVATKRSEQYGKDPEDQWFWIWSEQATGIDFEVDQILSTTVNERKSLMFASGDLPDVLFGVSLSTSELVRYGVGEGLLLDLTPYITPEIMPHLCKWIEAYPQSIAYCTTPDGKIYTLPGYSDFYIQADGPNIMQLNTEWLEEAGLEMPKTLDEFTAMLYKFKELHPEGIALGSGAKNGEGKEARDPRNFLLNAFGYLWPDTSSAYTIAANPAVREGKAVIPAYDDTFVEFLKLMNQYYTDGLMSKDFFTIDQTTAFAQLAEDSVGAYAGVAYLALPEKEDFTKWVDTSPLTSQWNETAKAGALNKFRYGNVSLNANIDPNKIETVMRYLDYFYSDLGGMYLWCGPAATSADTLGIIGGYTVTEDNAYVWLDKDGNKMESQAFMEGDSGNIAHGFGNRSHPLENKEAFDAGVTNRPEMRSYYYNKDNILPYNYDPNFGSGAHLLNVRNNVEPYRAESFPMVVYYDEETTLAIDELHTILDPYIESEMAKFITGARDLSEFSRFQEELKGMGVEELLGYYTQAYENYLAAKQ
ncbi:MAG: extracellular solute-binding protein [Eubacteriales bacterium]|nr:extracellular solute-binding protein [Eubacteriales bacterium]